MKYYSIDNEGSVFRPTHLFCYDKNMDFLTALGEEIRLPKHRTLLSPNTAPKYCYYVLSGRIIRCGFTAMHEEVIYDSFGEGALIFELEALLDRKLKTIFKTATPCVLIQIPPDALLEEISTNKSSMLQFLEYLASVRLHGNRQARETSLQCVEWKICKLLLTFAEQYGENYDGKIRIKEKITQETLGKMLNISRGSVVRTFKELRDLNLLEQVNGYYCIRSVEQMRRYMDKIDNLTF